MLEKLTSLNELASFLGVGVAVLKKLKPEDHYHVFQIPKPGKKEKRTIEAPKGALQFILDRLADGLQWSYSDHRTHAAHGYIRSTVNDPDKRTIFTNASKHLGKKYLLNIDLDNFFHQITDKKVREIFSDDRFFRFDFPTVEMLTKLVCYQGRLPMGSPTSPPLSNFATYDLDLELSRWTRHQKITYTRFVDDLSFSSNKPLTENHFKLIEDALFSHKFLPDDEKIKWFGTDDIKEVTGLIVGDKISLPDEYLTDLEAEIDRMHKVRQEVLLYPDYSAMEWLSKLERVISGRLAFVKAVYGKENPIFLSLLQKQIQIPEPEDLSISWRYAGYEYYSI